MSKAVPWSTLVRKNGSPTVTFTPPSRPISFMGMCPWSWYCTTTISNSPFLARAKTVSGGWGPLTSMLASLARVRVQACDGYLGLVHPDLCERVSREVDNGQDPLSTDAVYRLSQGDVGAHVDDPELRRLQHHREVFGAG